MSVGKNEVKSLAQHDIYKAIKSGYVEQVQYFIKAGFNINTPDKYGDYPIHLATSWNNLPILKILMQAGAKTDVKDQEGNTPLHLAVKMSHRQICEYLLNAHADTEALNNDLLTPINIAYRDNNPLMLRVLTKAESLELSQKSYVEVIKAQMNSNLFPKKMKSNLQQYMEKMESKRKKIKDDKNV